MKKNKKQKEEKSEKAKKRVGADQGRFLTDSPSDDFFFSYDREGSPHVEIPCIRENVGRVEQMRHSTLRRCPHAAFQSSP